MINAEPTEAQKQAGNYKKHHARMFGLDISIENKRGSTRSGTDAGGEKWSVKMPADYGYIKRTEGADGDHVDCYVGPAQKCRHVTIIDQVDADTGKFDEHKVMLGFPTKASALAHYRRAFSDGRAADRIGATKEMDIDDFKCWLENGDTTKPAAKKFATGGAVKDDLPDAPWAMPNDSALPDAPWAASSQEPPILTTDPKLIQVENAPSAKPMSALQKAAEPITSYPETYHKMRNESVEQMSHGVDQLAASGNGAWETAKGAGNVALGSLGFVTSPINAALRTVVGKPLEENTGIPKEYSEFAASLALPGIGLKSALPVVPAVTKPLTKADEIAAASQRLSIPIPKAAVTDSVPTQMVAGALKEVPVVGTPLVKSSKAALEGLDNAARDTAKGFGSANTYEGGQAAASGLENWITGKSGDVAKRVYDKVDGLVDPNFTRPLDQTANIVSDIMAKRANAKISGKSKAVDEVLEAVQSPGGLNYDGVKDLRTYFRDLTPDEMVAKGISKTEAKRIYGALTQDMRATVEGAGGQEAIQAFDKANTIYDQIAARREALAKIIGVKADAAPERVMDRIMQMASTKGGANQANLVQARRAIGPEKWNEVTSAVISRLGRASPEAEFSGDRFVTAYNNLSESGKKVLFNSTGQSDLAQSVQDIMTLSQAHKQLMKYGNPSGTGRVGSLLAAGASLVTAPVAALATAVGGNMIARVLSSPVTARAASNWSKAYAAAAAQQSVGAMQRLSAASNGLALVLNRNFGLDAKAVMQRLQGQLQGPVPVRADDKNQ